MSGSLARVGVRASLALRPHRRWLGATLALSLVLSA